MNELEELSRRIRELEEAEAKYLSSLNSQRAVIDYLLDALEQLALDNDLEEQAEAIIQRIMNGELNNQPKIIL